MRQTASLAMAWQNCQQTRVFVILSGVCAVWNTQGGGGFYRGGSVNQTVRAAGIGIRNILLGANLRSLSKLLRPRQLAFYSTQTLFFYDSLFRNGLPVRNVRDILPHDDFAEVSLFLGTNDFWINDVPSGGSDLVSLCLITRLVRPKRIFEIGTYRGYTALQFAANAPDAE